jgi:DnaJ-class molecular chaperone
VEREIARPVHFAGASACSACHDAEPAAKEAGKHRNLSCETCHGPAAAHIENPDENKPYVPRDRTFCPVCHAYDPSRPTGFPQINPAAHNPLKPCIACHDPHAPVPPQTPHDCAACHGEIARTKAVSAHALLECTTCHPTPEEHFTNPTAALPGKPQTRAFCGRCHGENAENPDAVRIDLATHGAKYLCWQCHYPHLPEGK